MTESIPATGPTATKGNPVVLVDDERHIRIASGQTLELAGYEVTALAQADGVLSQLAPDWPGVVVTDINMPGTDGLALMRQVQEVDRDIPVILITGHGDISTAVSAMRDGAYDFIEKPFPAELLTDVVRRAVEKRALTLEIRQLRHELEAQDAPGPRIIGRTPAIQRMRSLLLQVADTPADLLIMGETGTGKDLVARYIHETSRRKDRNFVAINCGAMPENLIESELFGHEKGAFTDAKSRRIGKLEHAHGGTLFLDEIESMPLALQVKLLRVLEERSIERLGANEAIPLDLRILAATKADLRRLSNEGGFREDLYYRLNVVRVDIPPLRERIEDIPLLFQHFALIASAQYQREATALSPERLHSLMSHDWPGNVRELRNIAERYVLLGEAGAFDFEEMSLPDKGTRQESLPDKVERFERMLIEAELARCQGCIKDALVRLGLPRKTLYDKMRKYGLSRQDYRN